MKEPSFSLDLLQKKLDQARLLVIKHDQSYDDEMLDNYNNMIKPLKELKEMINFILELE